MSSALPSDLFSVNWTGQVQPLYNGVYTFYAAADDGIRLYVANNLIIDKWVRIVTFFFFSSLLFSYLLFFFFCLLMVVLTLNSRLANLTSSTATQSALLLETSKFPPIFFHNSLLFYLFIYWIYKYIHNNINIYIYQYMYITLMFCNDTSVKILNRYSIRLEYMEIYGQAAVSLSWSSACQPRQVLLSPVSLLSPTSPCFPPLFLLSIPSLTLPTAI